MSRVKYAIVPAYVGPIALQFTVVKLSLVTMLVQELSEGRPVEFGGGGGFRMNRTTRHFFVTS